MVPLGVDHGVVSARGQEQAPLGASTPLTPSLHGVAFGAFWGQKKKKTKNNKKRAGPSLPALTPTGRGGVGERGPIVSSLTGCVGGDPSR